MEAQLRMLGLTHMITHQPSDTTATTEAIVIDRYAVAEAVSSFINTEAQSHE